MFEISEILGIFARGIAKVKCKLLPKTQSTILIDISFEQLWIQLPILEDDLTWRCVAFWILLHYQICCWLFFKNYYYRLSGDDSKIASEIRWIPV